MTGPHSTSLYSFTHRRGIVGKARLSAPLMLLILDNNTGLLHFTLLELQLSVRVRQGSAHGHHGV